MVLVTLGTQTIFLGVLISYVGSEYISASKLPPSVSTVSANHLVDVQGGGYLHILIVPVIIVALLIAAMLRWTYVTTFARFLIGVYAMKHGTRSWASSVSVTSWL